MNKFETWQHSNLIRKKDEKLYKGYLIVFIVVIILMRFVNELSTNISTYIQSSVVNEFFVSKGMTYEEGLASFTTISLGVSSFAALAIFYKPLADVLGRKTTMVINTIGIALGMICTFISPSVYLYCVGVALYTFFTQNDIQMVYIVETAPHGKGARLFGTIKSIGILGLVFVPLLRDLVMKNDPTMWRNMYLGPMILSFITAVLIIIFLKETSLFRNRRLEVLENPIKSDDKNKKTNSVSLGASVKSILKSKKLRILVIAYTLYGCCSMPAYMYVESLMTTNGMSTSDITKALYVYPFVYAFLSYFGGVIADKIGRKAVVVTCGLFTAFGFIGFLLAIKAGASPYLIGLLEGIYLGGYFVSGDYLSIVFMENVPTEQRASFTSASNLLMMFGMIFGIGIMMALLLTFGLNIAAICIISPCMLIAMLIVIFKVKETKNTKLNEVSL